MEVDIKVHGLAELEKKLLKLGAEVGEKELYKALMSASLPAFKAAKAGAPLGKTGSLKKAVQRRRFRAKKSRRLNVRGVGSAQKNTAAGLYILINSKKAPHGHLVHEGTDVRRTKGKGRRRPYQNANRGVMPKNPFLLKAWNAHGDQKAVSKFATKLKKNLKKYER